MTISHELRQEEWSSILLGSNADIEVAESKVLLDSMTDEVVEAFSEHRVVEQDVERTRGEILFFRNEKTRMWMRRALTAVCFGNSEGDSNGGIEYMQGLNEVLAPFLLLGASEEALPPSENAETLIPGFSPDTHLVPRQPGPLQFALFRAFVKRMLPATFAGGSGTLALRCSLRVFGLLVNYHEPLLWQRLEANHMLPEVYATPWFVTLLSRHTLPGTLFELWDRLIFLAPSPPPSDAPPSPPIPLPPDTQEEEEKEEEVKKKTTTELNGGPLITPSSSSSSSSSISSTPASISPQSCAMPALFPLVALAFLRHHKHLLHATPDDLIPEALTRLQLVTPEDAHSVVADALVLASFTPQSVLLGSSGSGTKEEEKEGEGGTVGDGHNGGGNGVGGESSGGGGIGDGSVGCCQGRLMKRDERKKFDLWRACHDPFLSAFERAEVAARLEAFPVAVVDPVDLFVSFVNPPTTTTTMMSRTTTTTELLHNTPPLSSFSLSSHLTTAAEVNGCRFLVVDCRGPRRMRRIKTTNRLLTANSVPDSPKSPTSPIFPTATATTPSFLSAPPSSSPKQQQQQQQQQQEEAESSNKEFIVAGPWCARLSPGELETPQARPGYKGGFGPVAELVNALHLLKNNNNNDDDDNTSHPLPTTSSNVATNEEGASPSSPSSSMSAVIIHVVFVGSGGFETEEQRQEVDDDVALSSVLDLPPSLPPPTPPPPSASSPSPSPPPPPFPSATSSASSASTSPLPSLQLPPDTNNHQPHSDDAGNSTSSTTSITTTATTVSPRSLVELHSLQIQANSSSSSSSHSGGGGGGVGGGRSRSGSRGGSQGRSGAPVMTVGTAKGGSSGCHDGSGGGSGVNGGSTRGEEVDRAAVAFARLFSARGVERVSVLRGGFPALLDHSLMARNKKAGLVVVEGGKGVGATGGQGSGDGERRRRSNSSSIMATLPAHSYIIDSSVLMAQAAATAPTAAAAVGAGAGARAARESPLLTVGTSSTSHTSLTSAAFSPTARSLSSCTSASGQQLAWNGVDVVGARRLRAEVLSAVSASKAGREKLFGHVLSPLAEATRHAERGLRGHHHHHRHLSERDEEEEEEEEKEVERSNDGGGGSSGGGSNSGAGGSGSGGIKRGTRGESSSSSSSSSSHAVAASMKGVESDNPGGVVLAELVATKVAVVHATLEQLCRDMNAARPADVDDEDDDAATAAMSTDVATTTAAAAAVSASTEISSSAAAAASDSSASDSAVIAATAPHNTPTPVQRTRGLGFLDLNHRGRLARSPVGPASISSALGETVPLPEPVGAAMVPAAQVPLTTNTTQDDEDEDGSMAI